MIKVYQVKAPQRDLTPSRSLEVLGSLMLNPTAELVGKIWQDMYQGIGYQLVAEVDTDKLDQAFYLTNSIDDYWGLNEGVAEFNTNHRSTSVGDIMERDGKWYVVAPFGFNELTW